jgi:Rrf2 family protein
MLSQKGKYALKAMIDLARHANAGLIFVADIAERQRLPVKFLEIILLDLKRHGLVYSQRGKNGGYSLARPASEITVGQIVRIVDGPLAPLPCASLTGYRKCSDCGDENTCIVRGVMREVRDAVSKVLDSRTLADLIGVDGVGLETSSYTI